MECNMLNPDSDDSQDSDNELFTQEYFDQMDSKEWIFIIHQKTFWLPILIKNLWYLIFQNSS